MWWLWRCLMKHSVYKFCFCGMRMRWFGIAVFVLLFIPFSSAAIIFSDDFESGGLSGCNLTVNNSCDNWLARSNVDSDHSAYQGSWFAESAPDCGPSQDPASRMERIIDTTNYSSINFTYYRRLHGLDSGDYFRTRWYNGSAWATLEESDNSPVHDPAYVSKNFSLSSAASRNSNFKIRFECTALTTTTEYCQVDEVYVVGVLVDLVSPTVSVISPVSGIYYNSLPVRFNVSLSEAGNVRYSLDGGVNNKTMTANASSMGFNATNGSIADGSYVFSVYANDSNENVNNTVTVSFGVDRVAPTVNVVSPSPVGGSNQSNGTMVVNVTGSESNLQSAFVDLDGTNYSLTCGGSYSCSRSFSSLAEGGHSFYVWLNDSAGNSNSSSVRTFSVDTVLPIVSMGEGTESSSSNRSVNWVYVHVSVSENNEKNITFSLFNASGVVNRTTFNNGMRIINWTGLSDGSYFYNVSVYDYAGNFNVSETRVIGIDTVIPGVSYGSGVVGSGSIVSASAIYVNVSVSESNEKNISFILFNSSGVVNQTIFSSSVRTMNWSSLAQGNYSYNVSVYDYAGNANHTAVRMVYLDMQSPSLSVSAPSESEQFGTNVSLSLNFSVSDSHLESCWYGIDGGVNVSLSSCLNLSFSISEGSHVLRMYANDSAGNMIGVSKSFNVQVGAPSIVISSPVTGAYVNASQIGFVYTASDIDLQSCELWGNFSGSFGLNQTNGSVVSGQESSFGLSLLDGAYLWHIRCNDTLANYGISSNSTVIVDTIYPIINVNQPLGTKTNRTNIAASFNVSDVHLASCWYSVLRGGVADIGNTSVGCTENVVFNVTVDADFMFYLYANDSAGNVNLSSSSFSVSTSSSSPGGSPGGGGSSGGSGGGGGGGGGAAG